MENAPGAHGEEDTVFGQKHLLEHCPKKPHWETAPNSGLSQWQTQVCLYFASLGHFLPSRGILAQMCLTHERELPIPEPPAPPVWTGLTAGGSGGMEEGRARGAAAAI